MLTRPIVMGQQENVVHDWIQDKPIPALRLQLTMRMKKLTLASGPARHSPLLSKLSALCPCGLRPYVFYVLYVLLLL